MEKSLNIGKTCSIKSLYLNVKAFDSKQLSEDLRENRIPKDEAILFQSQLAEAILENTLTPECYKDITGDNEYNSPEELETWLRDLWKEIYQNEPVTLAP
jgi:hypothetical protein